MAWDQTRRYPHPTASTANLIERLAADPDTRACCEALDGTRRLGDAMSEASPVGWAAVLVLERLSAWALSDEPAEASAETDDEAWDLANSLLFLRLMAAKREQRLGLVPPDETRDYRYSPEEQAFVEQSKGSLVVGTPDRVRAQIEQIAVACGTREVAIVTVCYDMEARRRSYQLVAEAFGLEP